MSDVTPFVEFDPAIIRHVWHEGENWFSVIDVIGAVTGSAEPKRYWSDMRRRETAEARRAGLEIEPYDFCVRLKMMAPDGKMRLTDAANTEGLFRILQSVPSPKVEPFKRWLAKVGRERLEEERNPELAAERTRAKYRSLGYSEDWIAKRMRGINTHAEMTDEFKARGAQGSDYRDLTAIISRGTFGLAPSEHKAVKGLNKENLRDHMSPLELLFTEVGEASATQLTRGRDSQGRRELERDAKDAGSIAGDALRRLERESGQKVVTSENHLDLLPKRKGGKQLPPGNA